MKIRKDTQTLARRLFGLCLVDGRVDEEKVRTISQRILTDKPRNYIALLHALTKLIGYEMRRYTATIQSAQELTDAEKSEIRQKLEKKYGTGLIFEWHIDPSLIGGIKMRVGDDLIDGSISSRIDRLKLLASSFSK